MTPAEAKGRSPPKVRSGRGDTLDGLEGEAKTQKKQKKAMRGGILSPWFEEVLQEGIASRPGLSSGGGISGGGLGGRRKPGRVKGTGLSERKEKAIPHNFPRRGKKS